VKYATKRSNYNDQYSRKNNIKILNTCIPENNRGIIDRLSYNNHTETKRRES
jgi:hypothetical protein